MINFDELLFFCHKTGSCHNPAKVKPNKNQTLSIESESHPEDSSMTALFPTNFDSAP